MENRNVGQALPDNALKGFTLIELLVVVLIIAILAAIAVPQYQKAVEKTRATEAITLLKSIYNAAEIYYMEHGKWPATFADLDVQIPWSGTIKGWETSGSALSNEEWSLGIRTTYSGVYAVRLKGPYQGGMFLIYKKVPISAVPQDTLICGELKSGDFKFQKNEGAFCEQIWNGKKLGGGNETRLYSFLH